MGCRGRKKKREITIPVDLIEDKTVNRYIFVMATILAYLYLTFALYLSGVTVRFIIARRI